MTIFETLLALIGSLGGLELVKYLISRKQYSRIEEAQADGAEFQTLQNVTEFLQLQLKDKEERFAEQTSVVRQLNRDMLDAGRKISELEIELMKVRCDRLQCPQRLPPNVYTPRNYEDPKTQN